MDLEQQLHESLVAPDPGAEFTEGVMARVGQHWWRRRALSGSGRPGNTTRGRRRVFVLGVVALAAMAAAVQVARLSRAIEPPDADEVSASRPVAAVPDSIDMRIELAGPNPEVAPAPVTPATPVPAPAVLQRVEEARYLVLLMPLLLETQDVAAKARAEAFHAAVVEELRKVSGLGLLVQNDAAPSPQLPVDFVVTMTGLEPREPGVAQVQSKIQSTGRWQSGSMTSKSLIVDGVPQYSARKSAVSFVELLRQRILPRD